MLSQWTKNCSKIEYNSDEGIKQLFWQCYDIITIIIFNYIFHSVATRFSRPIWTKRNIPHLNSPKPSTPRWYLRYISLFPEDPSASWSRSTNITRLLMGYRMMIHFKVMRHPRMGVGITSVTIFNVPSNSPWCSPSWRNLAMLPHTEEN